MRRRQVWLPTLWGWLGLVLVLSVSSVAAARSVNRWLSVDVPAHGADGHGARVLVVEGWMGAGELEQAIQTFRRGHYRLLVTTGGPTYEWQDPQGRSNYADRAAAYLRGRGLPAAQVIAVPAPASAQDRTFLSAVMVRDWAARSGTHLDAIDLYSVAAHTRRSRLVYEMAFGPTVEIGALAAQPLGFDADRWWTSSIGAKSVVGELISIGWTVCCFWPPPRGSHEERWAVPPASATPVAPAPVTVPAATLAKARGP